MLATAAPYWSQYGISCDVLSTGEAEGPFAETLRQAGYQVHHIPLRRSPAYLLHYATFLRSHGYDVVHIHPERAYLAHAAIARTLGTPGIVRSTHNCFIFPPRARIAKTLQRRIARRLSIRQLSVSNSVKETEWEQFSNPTEVIWNWYDSDRFNPPTIDQRTEARSALAVEDNFVILSLSNASSVKNQGAIISALSALPSNLNVIYLNVGQETKYESNLACTLSLESRVRFCGPQANPLPYLWAADLFVMPSLYEGLSIAALEAMGTGLFPILSDVRGLRDFKLISGLVVEWSGTDSISVGQSLLKASQMPTALRRQHGLRNHEIISSLFSARGGVANYVRAYNLAISPLSSDR